jgi:FtsH-binding integral membrane protein
MADLRNYQSRAQTGEMIDQGLRAYMLKVYNLMALGLAITGVAAYLSFQFAFANGELTAFGQAIYVSPLKWVVILAPLALVFFLSFRINTMTVAAAQTTFAVYAALVGLSLSSIFLIYTGQSVVQTFFVTAASFGALSLYGYTTKRNLSAMGSFLMMGLFGLIIASLVNIFLASSEADDVAVAGRKAIMGALTLYLDFINLFMFLLQFMGNRK